MTAPALTAVVLSYDGRHLLEVVLPSLGRQTVSDLEVVVVDNGSTDGTQQWLREHWPKIRVVVLPENVGVTAALNVCARAGSGEFVALLNNDLELEPDALEVLVDALREHPDAASASPKLLDFGDRGVLDGAGDTFEWQGTGMRRGHGEEDAGQYDQPQAIFGACGGAAVYRRTALEAVGPFDEDFFAFFEDLDWAFRAQLAGYACRYAPAAVVYHMGSATLGRGMTDFTRYHLWRNSLWLVAKDYPVGALLRHAPELLRVQLANVVVAWWDGKLDVWRSALGDGLRGLPAAMHKRRGVQRTRRRGVAELEAVVADTR